MLRHLWAVPREHAGRRADTVLLSLLPAATHGELCRWLRRGLVRVNGKRAEPGRRLAEGEQLALPPWALPAGAEHGAGHQWACREQAAAAAEVANPVGAAKDGAPAGAPLAPAAGPRGREGLPAPQAPLDVRYEDDDLLIVYKPPGLASHGGIGHQNDNLAARLVMHCRGSQVPGTSPGLAQRLDCGVSGLLACGKHPAALKKLMGPPHGPPLVKLYLAVVAGSPQRDLERIALPLRVTDQPRGDAPKVVVDRVAGVAARTDCLVLWRSRGRALLAVRLHTGRTHQIRAHLRAAGLPLLGDPRYGEPLANAKARASWGTERPLLHAAYLRLRHPMAPQQWPSAYAEPPADMGRALGVEPGPLFCAALAAGRLAALDLGAAAP